MYPTPSTSNAVISKKAIIVGLALVLANWYWVGIASELWCVVYTLVSPFSEVQVFNVSATRGMPKGIHTVDLGECQKAFIPLIWGNAKKVSIPLIRRIH